MTVAEVLNLAGETAGPEWENPDLGCTETWSLPSLQDASASTCDSIKASEILYTHFL